MFSHPESDNKISNLVITELFYSRILNMNIGCPQIGARFSKALETFPALTDRKTIFSSSVGKNGEMYAA